MSNDTQETMTVDEAMRVVARARDVEAACGMPQRQDAALLALAAEVERYRRLFGAFQLECCDDWRCAQGHARKAGEVVGELRESLASCQKSNRELSTEVERLRVESAAWKEHALRIERGVVEWTGATVEARGKLGRFEEREPLVQALVNAVMDDCADTPFDELACAVVRFDRDAKVESAEPALVYAGERWFYECTACGTRVLSNKVLAGDVHCEDCSPAEPVDGEEVEGLCASQIEAACIAHASSEKPVNAGQCAEVCCTQRTKCAVCLDYKHTPLRRDDMGGYVCLTCIDAALTVRAGQYKSACWDRECLWKRRDELEAELAVMTKEAQDAHALANKQRTELAELNRDAQPPAASPVRHKLGAMTSSMSVDTALSIVEQGDPPLHALVLAAEVRQLREENIRISGLKSTMELKKRALDAERERDELRKAQQSLSRSYNQLSADRDRLAQQVTDLTAQLQSMIERGRLEADELSRTREQRDVALKAQEAAELRIVELRKQVTDLAERLQSTIEQGQKEAAARGRLLVDRDELREKLMKIAAAYNAMANGDVEVDETFKAIGEALDLPF